MQLRQLFAGMLLMLALANTAAAQHSGDVVLSVPAAGGPIATGGGIWTGTYAGRVFEGVFPVSAPCTTYAPGFDSLTGTFPAGDTIRLDFAKELLFWDGAALVAPNVGMTLDYQGVRSATISGADVGGLSGFVITSVPSNGSFHEHIDYTVPNTAADGLYGVVLTLGPGSPTTAFTTSDSFLVTFEQGTSLSSASYAAGMQAMVDVALVPEPGGLLLALAGIGGGWLVLRRSRGSTPAEALLGRPI
jgi:hypothetical protein